MVSAWLRAQAEARGLPLSVVATDVLGRVGTGDVPLRPDAPQL